MNYNYDRNKTAANPDFADWYTPELAKFMTRDGADKLFRELAKKRMDAEVWYHNMVSGAMGDSSDLVKKAQEQALSRIRSALSKDLKAYGVRGGTVEANSRPIASNISISTTPHFTSALRRAQWLWGKHN